jgi:hypothetical protein
MCEPESTVTTDDCADESERPSLTDDHVATIRGLRGGRHEIRFTCSFKNRRLHRRLPKSHHRSGSHHSLSAGLV